MNLREFDKKLRITYLILFGSEVIKTDTFLEIVKEREIFFVSAGILIKIRHSYNSSWKLKWIGENLNLLSVICTKSRMSFTIFNISWFERSEGSTNSCTSR